MNFSDLTIVCITYGRPKFVGRLIEYWQKNFNDATFFILDGSDQCLDDKYLNKINEKKLNYIHMQNVSIFQRYLYIKKIIKTKYFQLVADDEIFVPSGIKGCLEFLEKNPSHSSCAGKMILFTPLLKKEDFALSPYHIYSNENLSGSNRVQSWLNDTQPNTIYSILRSENYIKILNECEKFDERKFSKPENFFEDLIEIGTSYQGKTKIINELMWLRSVENPRIGLGEQRDKPENVLYDNSQKNKKFFFDNFIGNYLENLKTEDDDKTQFDLKSIYYERLRIMNDKRQKNFLTTLLKPNYVKIFLFKFIPRSIKQFIRFYLKLNGVEIIKFLKNNKEDIIFKENEILDIKNFILNFYNDKFYK